MKHTPGPFCFKDAMVYSETTGQTIAMVDRSNKADGYLFAAAPDMLEALETFQDAVKKRDDVFRANYGSAFDTALGMTNEAVRKARGKA